MAKFVNIHSNITISVTAGLQNEDVTNKDAHVPDRLKVSPLWPKLTVLVNQGSHWYPSEIAEWATVKALAKDKILTIGSFSDTCEEPEVVSKKESLNINLKEVKTKLKESNAKLKAGATLENISAEV